MDPSNFVDLPLPRPAEKAHLNAEGIVPPRVRWQYHYLGTYFGAGSHYIILDNVHDSPDLGCLGGFGYVTANGQALMFPRLKTRIQSGESIVMLHNTGGVTQAFTSLRKAMLGPTFAPDPAELLEKLELVSPGTILCGKIEPPLTPSKGLDVGLTPLPSAPSANATPADATLANATPADASPTDAMPADATCAIPVLWSGS